jgi:hypothetical protein
MKMLKTQVQQIVVDPLVAINDHFSFVKKCLAIDEEEKYQIMALDILRSMANDSKNHELIKYDKC